MDLRDLPRSHVLEHRAGGLLRNHTPPPALVVLVVISRARAVGLGAVRALLGRRDERRLRHRAAVRRLLDGRAVRPGSGDGGRRRLLLQPLEGRKLRRVARLEVIRSVLDLVHARLRVVDRAWAAQARRRHLGHGPHAEALRPRGEAPGAADAPAGPVQGLLDAGLALGVVAGSRHFRAVAGLEAQGLRAEALVLEVALQQGDLVARGDGRHRAGVPVGPA
mmetsp:Transcript_71995/g.188681  ORF Transcript_71995/g.188681 Transcript_71995/m.188681 type:complete len:221 (-) Transcript_71995:163-825(-)